AQLTIILWFDFLWARFAANELPDAERFVLIPLVGSAASGVGGALNQRAVDIHWLNIDDWSDLGRSAGLMLDANTFGMSAAMWGPIAIAISWRLKRGTGVAIVAFLLLAAGMWTTGSRTALLTLTIGTI